MTADDPDATIEIRLLGPFDLKVDGVSVAGRIPRKGQLLIALLVLRYDHWLPRQEAAAALWPGHDAAQQGVSLRQQLSLLRKALGHAQWRLRSERQALLLDLTDAFVDLRVFQEVLGHVEGVEVDEAQLEQACRLYRGPFMEGHSEGCVQATRRALQQSYARTLMRLAEGAVARGMPGKAVGLLREGLAVAPEHEGLARLLMRLLIERGEREEACAVFEAFERAAQQSGQSAPGPEILALWRALQAPDREARPSGAPGARPLPVDLQRRRLPKPLTPLIGREEELNQIATRFCRHALVTLVGPGGVGKTRLAMEVVHARQEAYPSGTAFVDLSTLPEGRAVLPVLLRIAEALPDLGIREVPGRSLLQGIVDALSGQCLLLVIDNCEQVIQVCAGVVKELLQSCPGLHVLATSREALQVPGESVLMVPALDVPGIEETAQITSLMRAHAVRLFVERVRDRQPDFQIDVQNAAAIARICRSLDGLPLALELAAVMTDVLSLDELAEQIQSDYRLLSQSGDRTRPERYQTLEATIEWSYRALQPEEQEALHCIAVLAGDWTLGAAHAVCGAGNAAQRETLRTLSELVRKSLLSAATRGAETRYRLLGIIRQFGLQKLAASGMEVCVRERHARYFQQVVSTLEPQMRGTGQREALTHVELELENLREALCWARDAGRRETGLAIATAIWRYWFVRARYEEGQEWLQVFLQMPGDSPEVLLQRAYNALGNLAYARRDCARARRAFQEALTLAQQQGDRHACVRIVANLGNVAREEGNAAEARAQFEQCLEEFQRLDDRPGVARTLGNLAAVACQEADYARACAYHQQAVALFRELGDAQDLGRSLNNYADTLIRMGRMREAMPLIIESLQVVQEIGSRSDILHGLYNLLSLAMQGAPEEQAAVLMGAIEAYQELYVLSLPGATTEEMRQFQHTLRARLGHQRFEAARQQGRALPLGQVPLPLLSR
ncbi:MAG: tetratricopeptide repeat protein [Chloroherpetonaceae bacterium]|nr:tetratricopeptide repeat protein [Chthonomonadaceae bacterium]MDW8206429.1 tetratricopeptide repeat protein [Chloroherpetonaceae bacterium]